MCTELNIRLYAVHIAGSLCRYTSERELCYKLEKDCYSVDVFTSDSPNKVWHVQFTMYSLACSIHNV